MKIKQTMREIVERTRARENKYFRKSLLIAIIPTIAFTIAIIINAHNWTLLQIFLFPIAIVTIYLVSIVTIFDIFFGRSIYEVLSPKVNEKVNVLNEKVTRFFNTPNRVDRIEHELQTKDTLLTPNLEKILIQISQDFQNLDYKEMSKVFTEIFTRLTTLEKIVKNSHENEYPCEKCHKLFEAIRPDPTHSNPLRDKCTVCDMTNRPIFQRWTYPCDCGHTNVVYWHHKDGHTQAEIQMAEKLFYGSE